MAEKHKPLRLGRTISIDVRARAIAYAYFEDGHLRDCRVKTARSESLSNRARKVLTPYLLFLLDHYPPHAVLIPDADAVGRRERSEVSRRALRAFRREAVARGIKVHVMKPPDVKGALRKPTGELPKNGAEVNREVLRRFPELVSILPLRRSRAWQPEQYFTPLFNAVAMYIAFERQPSLNEERRQAEC